MPKLSIAAHLPPETFELYSQIKAVLGFDSWQEMFDEGIRAILRVRYPETKSDDEAFKIALEAYQAKQFRTLKMRLKKSKSDQYNFKDKGILSSDTTTTPGRKG